MCPNMKVGFRFHYFKYVFSVKVTCMTYTSFNKVTCKSKTEYTEDD